MNVDFWNEYSGDFKLKSPASISSTNSIPLKQLFLQRLELTPSSRKSLYKRQERFFHFSEANEVQENTVIVEEEITDLSDN